VSTGFGKRTEFVAGKEEKTLGEEEKAALPNNKNVTGKKKKGECTKKKGLEGKGKVTWLRGLCSRGEEKQGEGKKGKKKGKGVRATERRPPISTKKIEKKGVEFPNPTNTASSLKGGRFSQEGGIRGDHKESRKRKRRGGKRTPKEGRGCKLAGKGFNQPKKESAYPWKGK